MTSPADGSTGPLIIACGALAREIRSILEVNELEGIDVDYLPAHLHNTPDRITERVEKRLDAAGDRPVLVAYGDCGTGGRLDDLLQRRGIDRIPGAHCYQFFSGDLFERLQDAEPGTFYLTDFLTRHFDRLVWVGLGLDRHESMRDFVFGNYHRLVYLAQTEDAELTARAKVAAERLGLAFERHFVGCGGLDDAIVAGHRKATT
jgi:hypothetical protein